MQKVKVFFKPACVMMLSILMIAAVAILINDKTVFNKSASAAEVNSGNSENPYGGTDYYLDAGNGDDSNDGKSPDTAWQSLAMANATVFEPGDRILLKAGETWQDEQLSPQGSGEEGKPITITYYGDITEGRPYIATNGNVECPVTSYSPYTKDMSKVGHTGAVVLQNQQYWEIYSLELSNDNDFNTNITTQTVIADGINISIQADNFASGDDKIMDHFVIEDCYIHDIDGASTWRKIHYGGINFQVFGSKQYTQYENGAYYFRDVTIQNNSFYKTELHAIQFAFNWFGDSAGQYDDAGKYHEGWEQLWVRTKDLYSRDVYIGHNYCENIGQGAIQLANTQNMTVEYNEVNGYLKRYDAVSCGLYLWAGANSVMQYNEVYDGPSDQYDGTPWDLEYTNFNVTYQYNYSHDNLAGWMSYMGNSSNSIARYNLSVDDNGVLVKNMLSTNYAPTYFVNNIFVYDASKMDYVHDYYFKDTVYFYNNIFYNYSAATATKWYNSSSYPSAFAKAVFSNNVYYEAGGKASSLQPTDKNGITADPQFVGDPVNNPDGLGVDKILQAAAAYKLRDTSPLIDAGHYTAACAGTDFFGTDIYYGDEIDIGIYEAAIGDKVDDPVETPLDDSEPGDRVNLALGKSITASSTHLNNGKGGLEAAKLVDGDITTRWACADPTSDTYPITITIDFAAETTFDEIYLDEYTDSGTNLRIQEFKLQKWNEDTQGWETFEEVTNGMGHNLTLKDFGSITSTKLRLVLTKQISTEYYTPSMTEIQVYSNTSSTTVTGVGLNTSTLILTEGSSTSTLIPAITPSDATNKNVTWASGNQDVAAVSETGVVTPVSAGTATITVTTEDGGYTASCVVTVIAQTTNPSLGAISGAYDLNPDASGASDHRIAIPVILGGDAVTELSYYGSEGNKLRELAAGQDYTLTDGTYTLSDDFLQTLTEGSCTIKFIMASGKTLDYELTIIDTTVVKVNLALGKSITASSTHLNNGKGGLEASKLVDGDTATRWACADPTSDTYPITITIDFAAETTFDEIYLDEYTDLETNLRIQAFKLQKWNEDTQEWETFKEVTDGMGHSLTLRDFGSVTSRKLQLVLTEQISTEYYTPSMTEIQVYNNTSTVAVEGVSLNVNKLTLTEGGSPAALIPMIAPADATNQNVTWVSSNPDVAAVSEAGVVTPVSTGTATVTVTTEDGGYTASCVVTVNAREPQAAAVTGAAISIDKLTLTAGGSPVTLTPVITPADATNQNVTWKSSNTRIATVSGNGVVTPVSAGTAIITMTTEDGGYTAFCMVTVVRSSGTNPSTAVPDASAPEQAANLDQNGNIVVSVSLVKDDEDTNQLYITTTTYLLGLLRDETVKGVNLSASSKDFDDDNILILDAALLQAAKAEGKSITVTVKDEKGKEIYGWTFDKDILQASEQAMADIALLLDITVAKDVKELVRILGDNTSANGLLIHFTHEGVLPVQAKVRIYVGDREGITPGARIYLYHYNQETGKLDVLPNTYDYAVDQDGYIVIDIAHCSDYVVTTQRAAAGSIASLTDQITVTGDRTTLYLGNGYDTSQIKVELPSTLKLADFFTAAPNAGAVAGVTVAYRSSNEKVAAVGEDGSITALKPGKAIITTNIVLSNGGIKTVRTTITVKKPYITISSKLSKMKVGNVYTFQAEAYGMDSKGIKWSTTKKSILVIDSKTGKAAAKTKGTDYVVAKIGDISKKIKVVVK